MNCQILRALLLAGIVCCVTLALSARAQDTVAAGDSDDTDRDPALQKVFDQFPLLSPATNAEGELEFQKLTLKNPVVINRERFFGFRFTVPHRANGEDLVWSFVNVGGLKEWYILPQSGEMDGFTNYYTTSKGDWMRPEPLFPVHASRLVLQYLTGDNLKDGQTYLIWFGFGNDSPPAMSVTFTFAQYDTETPHPVEAFEKILPLHQLPSAPVVNPENHHTYILLRPTNWERAERLAEKMGGHLATVRNQQEEDWIYQTFGRYGGSRRLLWIGLTDLDKRFHFSWADGESAAYTDWAHFQPDNAGPRGEDYVAIWYPGHPNGNEWKVWNRRGRTPSAPMDGVVEIISTNDLTVPAAPAANVSVQILPRATITSTNRCILLQWPLSASDYILEATTNLSFPFQEFGYSEETNLETGVIYVLITNPVPQEFFKLKKQNP